MVTGKLVKPRRHEIWLVNLDPTIGAEIRKTRPCAVVSPDGINKHLRTIIVAPLTSSQKHYVSRVETHFNNRTGQIALDQIKTVDKSRLIKKLGVLNDNEASSVCDVLVEMFAK